MCGIFGISSQLGHSANETIAGLEALQHRGYDACGFAALDDKHFFHVRKELGLVKNLQDQNPAEGLTTHLAIGHVRYATVLGISLNEAQPLYTDHPTGITIAHNGNIPYYKQFYPSLREHYHINSTSDSEVLLKLLALKLPTQASSSPLDDFRDSAQEIITTLRGAYAVVGIAHNTLFGLRDPNGIRPLSLGKRQNSDGTVDYALASEDIAFTANDFQRVRDVNPAELILIRDGKLYSHQFEPKAFRPCPFEYIYFADPKSTINNVPVLDARYQMGLELGQSINEKQIDIDAIIAIPDSSRPAAKGISDAMGVPCLEGFTKRKNIRSFIFGEQTKRKRTVEEKFSIHRDAFEGKSVMLVDDSIVRGTTMRILAKTARAYGAKKVYLASAAPMIQYPNKYGIAIVSKTELIANHYQGEALANHLEVEGVFFSNQTHLLKSIQHFNQKVQHLENSIFDGVYITEEDNDEQ